jgi:phenylpyruvate tautomerase PptA (4-oxalocrotonate tautomerase family)
MTETEPWDAFVGIDWGMEDYEVCVLDPRGQRLGGRTFGHSGEGMRELCDFIAKTSGAPAERVVVVIELVRGAAVTAFLERGYAVFTCNPKQSDRLRDRHSPTGAKDDVLDAYVLADAGRHDRALLKRLAPDEPRVVWLRELARQHTELTEQRGRLQRRLHQQLHRYFPQLLELEGSIDAAWKLALWKRAPTPEKAQRLRVSTVRRLLSQSRVRKVSAEELVERLRAPKLEVAAGVTEAAVSSIALLIPQLELLRAQLSKVNRQMDEALARFDEETPSGPIGEQRVVTILRELPGAGRFVIATLLAEAWLALLAADYQYLRRQSGVAPITRRSGKQGRGRTAAPVVMRRACNRRLREALWHWARCAIRHDPHWRAQAAALRAKGHSMAVTHRILGDRLLRVACACLRDGTRYEHHRHAAMAA